LTFLSHSDSTTTAFPPVLSSSVEITSELVNLSEKSCGIYPALSIPQISTASMYDNPLTLYKRNSSMNTGLLIRRRLWYKGGASYQIPTTSRYFTPF
jgi:hypothetical protein